MYGLRVCGLSVACIRTQNRRIEQLCSTADAEVCAVVHAQNHKGISPSARDSGYGVHDATAHLLVPGKRLHASFHSLRVGPLWHLGCSDLIWAGQGEARHSGAGQLKAGQGKANANGILA